ncbi:hypothetical protein [Roseinatronobacter bogoriensis]|uniref:Uncharacterized protein n=1 Tax=Roseinatronobacter bogoriensis subsp. barguzinensis TaxID=441209 RepID=A0A2K8KCS0_9RHOB|nr:hypothetical protein [Rhodobaca]ATX65505.1 hypothetical protein BG454_06430 [Rhodobaca barguzinensis]MBB4209784.1 hypothetical protein [Rhodobaca bogoriensis DSM 18756]TDW33256.1 hypothetical protein LY39_03606 [Rhodobaca barguzinensis]TDY66054.1 hypothetical protein EV660_11413 [Rhodobaca bogoriensis DSM 18756]
MGLKNYQILLQMAVCDMARCPGTFRERLLLAWVNYIYKFNWVELEAMLIPEDLPVFQEFKKRMVDDLHAAIDSKRKLLHEQFKDDPSSLSDEQIAKYANAETVILAMSGQRAKRSVDAIVEMYAAVVATVDYVAVFPVQGANGGEA